MTASENTRTTKIGFYLVFICLLNEVKAPLYLLQSMNLKGYTQNFNQIVSVYCVNVS